MAKVNIEYDTVEKTASVKMDDKDVANCTDVSLGRYKNDKGKDEWHVSLGCEYHDTDNDMRSRHYMYASKNKPNLPVHEASELTDLVKIKKSIGEQVREYITARRS